jgi:hypothetical protein
VLFKKTYSNVASFGDSKSPIVQNTILEQYPIRNLNIATRPKSGVRSSRYFAREYYFFIIISLAIALTAAIAALVSEQPHPPTSLRDDFSGGPYRITDNQTSPNGLWYAVSDGGGSIEVLSDRNATSLNQTNMVLYEWTRIPSNSNESSSALTLSESKFRNFHLALDVRTKDQLRQNSPPNHWEVAWVIWHWNDNTHFNYFVVKTNGAETGKYDGGVNPVDQKILYSNDQPTAQIGKWMHWDITVNGKYVVVKVDGAEVFQFSDESSFSDGQIGLYCEDSVANFDDVYAQELTTSGT